MKINVAVILFLIVAVVSVGFLGVAKKVSSANFVTITVPASADTYVDSASPSTNFSTATNLKVHYPPSTQNSLIHFDVTGIPAGAAISQAVLKLYVANTSGQGGTVSLVGGAYTPSSVTWSTAPAVGATVATLPSASTVNSWIQTDVTSAITGNGAVDFYLSTTYSDAVYYASRETANPPTLSITYADTTATSSASSTPTAIPVSTPTATPVVSIAPNPTPIAVSGDPVIAATGDIGCALGKTCHMNAVYNLIPPLNPAAILTLGDTQYYCGSSQAFSQVYNPTWGLSKSITHPVVGNHEYLTSGATDCTAANTGAAGYFGYFGAAAGAPNQGYYSYDIGSWHFVALNTQCSQVGGCNTSSPQYAWLTNDLATHKNACTIAYYHIPLYSVGGRASTNSKPLFDLMYKNGVDVVLTGHDHIYERYVPQDASGNAVANGITEFVVGTGGSDHTTIATTSANLAAVNATTFGVLKMTLHPGSADYQFIPDTTSGNFTDSGTITCH